MNLKKLSNSGSSVKRLRLTYIIALSIIAAASVVSMMVVQREIHRLENDAPTINLAGRQRMLSQRLSKNAFVLSSDVNIERKKQVRLELEKDLELFKRSHQGLAFGDEELSLAGALPETAKDLYKKVDTHQREIVAAVDSLLKAKSEDAVTEAHENLLEAERRFLPLMDTLVFRLAEESNRSLDELLALKLVLTFITLMILLLEVFIIFEPAIQTSQKLLREIEEKNQDLRVTNDRLAESEKVALRESETKSYFLANMSHELRTPLNGVIGMTDLLLETKLSEEQKDLAVTSKESALALLKIVSEILDFSKLEEGGLLLEANPFSTKQLIADIEESYEKLLSQKGIALHSELQDGVDSEYIGDERRIKQVIGSILENAIKLNEYQGVITILIEASEAKDAAKILTVHISDSGIGISEKDMKLIFEALEQREISQIRKYGGTGLGLSIASMLSQAMGGSIEVSSREGMGTRFSISFKVGLSLSSPVHDSGIHKRLGKKEIKDEPLTILVAEDNGVNRKLAQRVLEKAGHTVTLVTNGLQALEKFREYPFDLILMDIQMPVMGGEEAVRLIRSNCGVAGQLVPIIALTAHALTEHKVQYLSAGMNGFVSKPLDKQLLFEEISKVLSETQMIEEV